MARRAVRKRRTREHVIHAQAALFVEALLVDRGHTAERFASDYGYDLAMFTYDAGGYLENGHVLIQVKASDRLPSQPKGSEHRLRIGIRDYNQWVHEPMPVFLVLSDAQRRTAYYTYLQAYFESDLRRRPRRGAKKVTVRLPVRNVLDLRAIDYMRTAKAAVLTQLEGAVTHHG